MVVAVEQRIQHPHKGQEIVVVQVVEDHLTLQVLLGLVEQVTLLLLLQTKETMEDQRLVRDLIRQEAEVVVQLRVE